MAVPKYIENKVNRLNKLLMEATKQKYEIEEWAKKNGIDTLSDEWYTEVIDDCNNTSGIMLDGLEELLKT